MRLGFLRWFDSDSPQILLDSPKVDAVLERAAQYAREKREDRIAVANVRAAADSPRTLKRAARASRFDGKHHELEYQNRVFRLVEAARTNKSVEPVAPEDQARIDAVKVFAQLPRAEQWALLLDREPRLRDVEQEVRSGVFGHKDRTPPAKGSKTGKTSIGADGREVVEMRSEGRSGSSPPRTEPESRELYESTRYSMALHRRVEKLVGRERPADDDVLLHTNYVNAVALANLGDAKPI